MTAMVEEKETADYSAITTIEAVLSENSCNESDNCVFEERQLESERSASCANRNDGMFKCEECTAEFHVDVNLRLHKAWVHDKSENKHKCPECSITFSRKAGLRSHLLTHCEDEFAYNHLSFSNKKSKKFSPASERIKVTNVNNEPWICVQCNQSFLSSSMLKEHKKLHIQLKSSLKQRFRKKDVDRTVFVHDCDTCGKKFKKKSQLIRHTRVHSGERPFICSVCGKGFTQKNSLETHKAKHTGEKKYKCTFCDATFTQSGNMRCHIDRVHAPKAMLPADQLFQCPFCSCVFKKIGSLNCHISRRHVDNSEELASTASNISYADADEESNKTEKNDLLVKAMEKSGVGDWASPTNADGIKIVLPLTDSETGMKQSHVMRRIGRLCFHQCLYCPKEFKKSSDLVRHIRIHTHERPFKCNQCYRSFTVKSTLNVHVRSHTKLNEIRCDVCGATFSSAQSLKVHNRVHSLLSPFRCNLCEKQFSLYNQLKKHLLAHQQKTKIKSGKQSGIEKSLLDKIQLKSPIVVSGDSLVSSNSNAATKNDSFCVGTDKRKYSCNHCEKAFKKSSHLKQHVLSHTGEKPYQCSLCSQAFVSNGSLKTHIRTHSGEKPYKCEQCSFQCTTKGSLTRHMTIHSNSRPFMCPYCQKTFKSNFSCRKHMEIHKAEIALKVLKKKSDARERCHLIDSTSYNCNEMSLDVNSFSSECYNSTPSNVEISLLSTNTENVCIPLLQLSTFNVNVSQPTDDASIVPRLVLHSATHQSNQPRSSDTNYIHLSTSATVEPNSILASVNSETLSQNTLQDNSAQNSVANIEISSNTQKNAHKRRKDCQLKSCQYCPKVFKKRSDLERHTRIHTGEKPFECTLCKKQFTVKSTLDSHIQTHKGERNFKCFVCNSLFATKGSLNIHTRLHTGYRPFKCDVCNMTFRTSGHLKSHSQKHEKQKAYPLKNSETLNSVQYYLDTSNVAIEPNREATNTPLIMPYILSSRDNGLTDNSDCGQSTFGSMDASLLTTLIQIDCSGEQLHENVDN
ncbi:zinc finger protein 236-like protein [Leptotrombidium deliense]|uniref:Zinc finger protein 236-like protein n=1 Tax=Leptotrombidium deliense TaxID=299467 RepID=A0A443SH63_9ACAR|nr:zinc finger protein 236-like protein [Leptotrombidium deliense]